MTKMLPGVIPAKRLELWRSLVSRALELTLGAVRKWRPVTVVLFGSVARGDFRAWSDVDVMVVSPAFRGLRVLDRLELVEEVRPLRVEVIPLTPEEVEEGLGKRYWRHMLEQGHVILWDDLGLANKLPGEGRVPLEVFLGRLGLEGYFKKLSGIGGTRVPG